MQATKVGVQLVVATMVAWAGTASAESWDGTYEHAAGGGNELCPDSSASVVVSGGKFSFPWNIKIGDQLLRVGMIEGSVRSTGFVAVKASVFNPLSAAAKGKLADAGDSIEQLQQVGEKMKLAFKSRTDKREINLDSGICYARWEAEGSGSDAEEPPPAKSTTPKAAKVKPPAPLAAGSAKWDASYSTGYSSRDDWRCPKASGKIVVKKGRFSIPWTVDAVDGTGQDYGEMSLGQIDGSVAANGKVKLRPWLSVSEMPPELAAGRSGKEATLAYIRALAGTMTFKNDGSGRSARLAFGTKCEYELAGPGATVAKKPPSSASAKPATTTAKPASTTKPASTKTGGTAPTTPAKTSPPTQAEEKKRGRANGASCTYSSDCESDSCEYHKCVSQSGGKKLGNGMECTYSSDCASDNCEYHKCASTGSKKELGTGADCVYSEDCASGSCEYHRCVDAD